MVHTRIYSLMSIAAFDEIMAKHNVEKIKTIGDAYMAVCGLPTTTKDHFECTYRGEIDAKWKGAFKMYFLG